MSADGRGPEELRREARGRMVVAVLLVLGVPVACVLGGIVAFVACRGR